MNSHDLKNAIAAAPFLKGMSQRHVEMLAFSARRTDFGEGKIVFPQGETANRFYLIEKGAVNLVAATKSGERRIVPGGLDLAECWAGRGCFHRMNGNSPLALCGKQARSFFTQRSCARIARRTRRSVLSSSSEWPRKW